METQAPQRCNSDPNSIPCRAYTFFVANEIDIAATKLKRRHFVLTSESMLKMLAHQPLTVQRNINPTQWGIEATGPEVDLRPGQHVTGVKPSPFTSFTTRRVGTRYSGQTIYLNTRRAVANGAKLISGRELVQDINGRELVQDIKSMRAMPEFQAGLAKLLKAEADVAADQEVLVKGYLSPDVIRSLAQQRITTFLHVLTGVSIVISAVDLTKAGIASRQQHTIRPLAKTGSKEVGGWAGAIAGSEAAGSLSALVGLETGPLDPVIAAGGGIAGGFIGYFAPDWLWHHMPARFRPTI